MISYSNTASLTLTPTGDPLIIMAAGVNDFGSASDRAITMYINIAGSPVASVFRRSTDEDEAFSLFYASSTPTTSEITITLTNSFASTIGSPYIIAFEEVPSEGGGASATTTITGEVEITNPLGIIFSGFFLGLLAFALSIWLFRKK